MTRAILPLLLVFCAIGAVLLSPASARPVTSLDLLTLHNIGGLSISPDGRHVVYQTYQADGNTNSYLNKWIVIDTATHASRELVGDGGQPVLTYEDDAGFQDDYHDDWASFPPVWAPDSTAFFFVRKGHDQIGIGRASLNGTVSKLAGLLGNVVDLHQVDASHALVSAKAPTPATIAASKQVRRDGLLFGFNDTAYAIESWGGGGIPQIEARLGPPDTSPIAQPRYYLLDTQRGNVQTRSASTEFTGADYTSYLSSGVKISLFDTLSPDRSARAFAGLSGPPGRLFLSALYVAPAQGKQIIPLTPRTPDSIASLQWSADSRQIYFLRQTDYVNQDLFIADTSTRTVKRLTYSGAFIDNCSFASHASLAACTLESGAAPENVITINLESGAITRLTNLNPDYDHLDKTKTQRLVWRNKRGDELWGELVYPRGYKAGKRYPLIVSTYEARGFQRGSSGDEYPIPVLAANGFFFLSVDTARSGDYGPSYPGEQISFDTVVLHWQSPMEGIEQKVADLSRQGLVDPRRVGICGLSYGSQMALYSISHSRAFSAAISHGRSGIDPMVYYLDNDWLSAFKTWGLDGSPYSARNVAKWKALSPALNANRTHAALLMNTPDKEYVLALQQYWEMRNYHRPVELWIYNDEDHTKHQPVHRLAVYNRNLDWFKYWLRGERDPAPAKIGQYKRWDALRADRDAHI